ncbi:MAG: TetR/AcrR family transcriptional regulator [Bacteroidetes bacterium]|nr:TetR/AcrR family transcriptional regulator [Bacteroidota bacterium]
MFGTYEKKKEQIKKASMNSFARYGYHKTTLDDIADQLGIKKNSLYYYFPSKEAIFNEIVVEEADLFIESLIDEIEKAKTIDKKINIIIHNMIYYAKEKSNLLTMPLKVIIEIGEIIENSHKVFTVSTKKIIKNVLTDGVNSGELKKHNTAELADNIFSFIDALQYKEFHSNQITSVNEIDFPNIEKKVVSIVNLVLKGLKV